MGSQQSLIAVDDSSGYEMSLRVRRIIGGPVGSVYSCNETTSKASWIVKRIAFADSVDKQNAKKFVSR